MADRVGVDSLRVGMFVHLDLGWMAHPFPLSNFKITSADQIEVIRGLGLSSVRWSPERSDPPAAPGAQGSASGWQDAPPDELPEPTPSAAPAESAEQLAERQRQAALAAELAAQVARQRLCERQQAEACRAWRALGDKVVAQPESARDAAHALSQALLEKMLPAGDTCVRVLAEPTGDRASAHALNVAVVAMLLARNLGMPAAELVELGTGALLHDIGKLNLPDRVRLQRDDFSAAEQALYRDHVTQGLLLAKPMKLPANVLLVLAQHHEHADGSGFPKGLTLAQQAAPARLVALVNHYDKLCNAAVPSRSLTPHEALSRMFAQSRQRFDDAMLGGFIRMMGIYPPGSLVQLTDGRFGMVMNVSSASPLKPRVRVFDPRPGGETQPYLDLAQAGTLGIRRSLRAEQLPPAALEALAPRQRVAYFFDVEPRCDPEAEARREAA